MSKNLIILRSSPDWINFDLESSRAFLKSSGLPENLVIDFAALWNRHFKVDYCSVRAQLKELALQTFKDVREASFLYHEMWDESEECEGRIAFVDDDDWMSPELFESLPEKTSGEDGVRWGGLRLGRVFAANGYSEPIIQWRPLNRIVYTNNYAVTSRAVNRLGSAALFEHGAAQAAFDQPDFALVTSDIYLSCAVKHPCCTSWANNLMPIDGFRVDPRRELSRFMDAVDAMRVEDTPMWLREPFAGFRQIMAEATQPR
jgi:hypothetical protein